MITPQIAPTAPGNTRIFPASGRMGRPPQAKVDEDITSKSLPRKSPRAKPKVEFTPAAVAPKGHEATLTGVIDDPTNTATIRFIAATVSEVSAVCGPKRRRLQRRLMDAFAATQRDESEHALDALIVCEEICDGISSSAISFVETLERAVARCKSGDKNTAQWNGIGDALNTANPNALDLSALLGTLLQN